MHDIRKIINHILWFLSLVCLGTGFTDGCNEFSHCVESPDTDWNEGIVCHSLFYYGGNLRGVNCSWLPYKSSVSSETAEYNLHLMWPKRHECDVYDIQDTSHIVPRSDLYDDEMATIWVSHKISDQLCVKTRPFTIVPEVNCQPPTIKHAVISGNVLRFQLDNIGQVRFRTLSSQWHIMNVTQDMVNVSLSGALVPETYVLQQRCLKESCFHCKWEKEINVPHELLGAPEIVVTTERSSPGRQRLNITWKYIGDKYVDEYIVIIQRAPDSCNYNIPLRTRNRMVHINLSVAFFNVSVTASNKAGTSKTSSIVVPPLAAPEFPGEITATKINETIFLRWRPSFSCDFFVVYWGTSNLQMKSKIIMKKMDNYSIPGPFEAMKRYTIMISLYDGCRCRGSTKETTYGLTYIYTEEGVPRKGPGNVTVQNVTKTSAVIEWEEIPEDDLLGFLLGYRISYIDTSGDARTDIFLNSSSQRYYKINGLAGGHTYKVRVAGVTVMGTGVPSAQQMIQTPHYDKAELRIIIIITCVGLIIGAVILVKGCVYTLHRAKASYLQEIPNPKHSHIVDIHDASGTQTLVMKLSPSDEDESCFNHLGVEVTPLSESIPAESSIQETDSGMVQKTPNHQKPSPAANVEDYTNMTSVLRVFQKPETTNYLQQTTAGQK